MHLALRLVQEYVKNRLRASMERLQKRKVSYRTGTVLRTGTKSTGGPEGTSTNTTGTTAGTHEGTKDQLEEERAFNAQVNRPEEDDTKPMWRGSVDSII